MFGSALTTAINVQIRADARQATRTMGSLSRSWRSFGQASSRLRAGLMGLSTMLSSTGVGLVAVGLAFRSSVRSMQAYSEQGARLRSIIRSSGQNLSTYPGLVASADQASRQWGFSMDEASAAMGTIIETGTNAADAMQVMAVSAEFARASETDLASSAQFLVDAYNQFSNGQNNPISQLRTLAATINVGSRITATSVEQMRQSFRYAAVEMSGMGYSAAETTAALGALASVGLKDMTAGTRLRQTLVQLGSPSRAAIELARSYHISVDRMNHITHDASGNIMSLTQAFDNWRSIMHDLPSDQARLRLSHQVVGSRALAGALLFGSVKGERFNRTLHQISDSEQILTNHGAAAQTRMQGFASQLLLTKGAAQELGISFAEILFGGEQGMDFGRQFRDFATAVRLSDESARSSDEARAAWNGLSSEMQRSGVEWRETFIGLANLLKMLGQAGLAIAGFVGEHPKLVAALAVTYAILNTLAPLLSAVVGIFTSAGIASAASAIGLTAAGTAAGGAAISFGSMAAMVVAGNAATLGINDAIVRFGPRAIAALGGVSGEYSAIRHESDILMDESCIGWFRYAPILGAWYSDLMDIVAAYNDIEMFVPPPGPKHIESSKAQQKFNSGFVETPRSPRSIELQRYDAEQQVNANLFSFAALLRSQGGSIEDARQRFRQANPNGGALTTAESNTRELRFASIATRMTQEQVDNEAARLRAAGIGADDLAQAFSRLELRLISFNPSPSARPGNRTVGDAYMTSSGFLPFQVSQGDLLINRNSLANAMVSGPGGLAPPTPASSAGESTNQHSGQRMQATVNLEIPVMIDGREVARVIGQRVLNMDQRRGVSIDPGRRERVAQHGA